MNKRKAKKERNKRELFISSFARSYRECRMLDRSYHEYVVSSKRAIKRCVGCDYLVGESCSRFFKFEPCVRGMKIW